MKTFHRKLKIYQLWKCVGVGGVHGARVRVGERVAGWVWVDGLSFQPLRAHPHTPNLFSFAYLIEALNGWVWVPVLLTQTHTHPHQLYHLVK